MLPFQFMYETELRTGVEDDSKSQPTLNKIEAIPWPPTIMHNSNFK